MDSMKSILNEMRDPFLITGFGVFFIFFVCCVFLLVLRAGKSFEAVAKNYRNEGGLERFRSCARWIAANFDWMVGKNIWRQFLSISLLNWIFLSTLCLMMLPQSRNWTNANSPIMALALHIWIWGNACADLFSYRVTRRCLDVYMERSSTLKNITLSFLKDLFWALACLYVTIMITNVAYLLQHEQSFSGVAGRYAEIFGVKNILEEYVVKSDAKPVFQFPGIFASVITSYVPTMFCLAAVVILLVALFFQSFTHYMTARDRVNHAVITFLLTSFIGMAAFLHYLR
jgi:hypothetical protein